MGKKLLQGTAVGGIKQEVEAGEQVLDFLAAEEVELLDGEVRDAVVFQGIGNGGAALVSAGEDADPPGITCDPELAEALGDPFGLSSGIESVVDFRLGAFREGGRGMALGAAVGKSGGVGGEQADDFVFGNVGVLDLVHLDPLEAHGPGTVEEVGEIEGVSLDEVLVIGEDGGAERDGEAAHVECRGGGEREFPGGAVGFHLRELLEDGFLAVFAASNEEKSRSLRPLKKRRADLQRRRKEMADSLAFYLMLAREPDAGHFGEETLAAAEDLSKQKHNLERELEKVEIEIAFWERVVADETRIAVALREYDNVVKELSFEA